MAESMDSGIPVLLVCPEDAARALGIGRTKVYELMRSGALRSVRLGVITGDKLTCRTSSTAG